MEIVVWIRDLLLVLGKYVVLFSAIYGLSPGSGTVSFKFLMLFVIDRAEPVTDDAFTIALLFDESKSDGKGYLESALAVISVWELPKTKFVFVTEKVIRIVKHAITNSRRLPHPILDSNMRSNRVTLRCI